MIDVSGRLRLRLVAPRIPTWFAAGALAFASGCGGDAVLSSPSPSASGSAVATASAPSAATSSEERPRRRTTPPAIALSNFQGQVRGAEEAHERRPDDLPSRARLVGFLLERGQTLGIPADLARAARLGAAAESSLDHEKTALALLRASSFSAVHRFPPAIAELDGLTFAPGRSPTEVMRARGAILAATGKLDEALTLVQSIRKARPEIGILTLEGKILGQMGKIEEAQRAFVEGEASYANPAPFALADLELERGLLAERMGDLTAAKVAFRAALDRLPQQAHAALHLATLVPPKEGIALLEPLLRTSQDPEVRGRLGLLRELEAKGSGEADLTAAATAYDAVLAELPEAYADHAAWFFLGSARDPAKAWSLAQTNLGIRPNADAFVIVLAAAREAKRPREETCALVARAKAYPWRSPALEEAIAAAACP